MKTADFESQFNELKNKYGVSWEWNCDIESLADGILFYKSEDEKNPFCSITGIGYDRDGNFGGDLEGFIKIMKSEFKKEYER